MNGKTHKIAGLCTGIIAAKVIGNPSLIETGTIAAFSVIGSLFPDIDEPNSIVGQKTKIASTVIKKAAGHRGFIHTPLNAIILTALIFVLNSVYGVEIMQEFHFPLLKFAGIGFFVGYLSHLLLDLVTPQGIMLFYPISSKKVHVFGFKSRLRDILCSAFFILLTIVIFVLK